MKINPIVNGKNLEFLKPFLEDLKKMTVYENGELTITGNIAELYERHPLVRVGIRRALLAVKKEYCDAIEQDQV